jgi:integrase
LREAARAEWAEIDLKARVWTIPPERFKSDTYHVVPLSDAVVRLLDELPRTSPFLFSVTGTPINGFSKPKARLHQLMDASDLRVHDLRRVVRTGLAKLKVSDIVAELIIGHGKRASAECTSTTLMTLRSAKHCSSGRRPSAIS